MTDNTENTLRAIIADSKQIVFFGGAGVSTESGIPDFRGSGGLYKQRHQYPPEVILSHSFFMQNTEEFYSYYRSSFLYPDAKPNAAHYALARMEKDGLLSAVITQNVDGLHQTAGSQTVFELHGSVRRNTCLLCNQKHMLEKILSSTGIPRCDCGGVIKPDVVLYEEPLSHQVMSASILAIKNADTLIVGGTSLNVYPAAGLTQYFSGKYLVLINRDTTSIDQQANLVIREPIGLVLGKLY